MDSSQSSLTVGTHVWDWDIPFTELVVSQVFKNGMAVAKSLPGEPSVRVKAPASWFTTNKPTPAQLREWVDSL